MPYKGKENKREFDRIYREKNRDKINEKKKEYRENNRDKINEKQKEYRKKYRETHKEYWNTKMTCECGIVHSLAYESTHLKTTLHKLYLETHIPYVEHRIYKNTWIPINSKYNKKNLFPILREEIKEIIYPPKL